MSKVIGPFSLWQQWTKIFRYFPNNPFSKEVGRLMWTWDKDGNKSRWIEITPLKPPQK